VTLGRGLASTRSHMDGRASDWNHLRRAVSRFLTLHLGDVYHPVRRVVVKAIPKRREQSKYRTFRLCCSGRSFTLRPSTCEPPTSPIAALGLRVGEYLRSRRRTYCLTRVLCSTRHQDCGLADVLRVDERLCRGSSQGCRRLSATNGCEATGKPLQGRRSLQRPQAPRSAALLRSVARGRWCG